MTSAFSAGTVAAICVALVARGGTQNTAIVERSTASQTRSTTSANLARVTATTGSTSATPPIQTTPPSIPRPIMRQWPIPYGAARKREMAAYSLRHYGEDTYLLSHPKLIVEHYTETATAQEAGSTMGPAARDRWPLRWI